MAALLFSSVVTTQRSEPEPSISNMQSSTFFSSATSFPSARGFARAFKPSRSVCLPTLKSMSRLFTAASIGITTRTSPEVCVHLYPSPSPHSTVFRPLGTIGSTDTGVTLPNSARCVCARWFRARTTSSVVCSSSCVDKSVLFTTTTSAHSTCSASSWPTFSSRALFFSSCLSPCTSSLRSCACRVSNQSLPKELASTTVTTRFTSVRRATGMVHSKPMAQFFLTASGSPTPLSSTTMCSNGWSFDRITMFCTAVKRSSAEEQQTQPFCNSVTSTRPLS
mmetsp:Transcript_70831/g.133886  ORF Transcript_70831/g.133886 Transcript_70831/m.133886 type:complete len:279 (-) Transcript_70831:357-1193(-)